MEVPEPGSKKSKFARDKGVEHDECQAQSFQLIERMLLAYDKDNQNNKEGKPAVNKLLLSEEVYTALRKFYIQDSFLSQNGLEAFEKWLMPLPDNHFPNQNLV